MGRGLWCGASNKLLVAQQPPAKKRSTLSLHDALPIWCCSMVESRHVGINRRVTGSSPVSGATDIRSFVSFCVYILQNPDDKFFISHNGNLQSRVFSYNRSDRMLGKFTRKNGPWTLVWSEQQASRCAAATREKEIHSFPTRRSSDLVLLNGRVPTRRD